MMMRKIIFILSLSFISISSFGQVLNILDESDSIQKGDTITYLISGTFLDSTHIWHINIKNLGPASSNVYIMRRNMINALGSVNSYCWGGGCYPPITNLSLSELLLLNGAAELKIEYRPKGNPAETLIKYTAFDSLNLDDSSWFYLHINPGVSKIEVAKKNVKVKAYPNPTKDEFIIEYNIPDDFTKTRIELVNVIGAVVQTQEIDQHSNKVSFDVSTLQNGVYFYRIVSNEGVLYANKVIVN